MSRWLPARRNSNVERRQAPPPATQPETIPLDLQPRIEFVIVGSTNSTRSGTHFTLNTPDVLTADVLEHVIRASHNATDVRRIN